jgi:large subunit ribosomal protein L25
MSITLKAEKREQLGTAASRKIKKAGRIPAIIYSPKGNTNLSLDTKDFETEYFKGGILTTVIELELDGKKTKVIAHKVELDPVSDRPIHVDFLGCDDSKTIRAKPKFIFSNQDKSLGLKRGGVLNIVMRRVEVICDNENSVPSSIEVDIAPLHIGSKVRASDIKLPAGVKIIKKGNFLVASITGRGKSDDDAASAQAAAPAAAKAEDKK